MLGRCGGDVMDALKYKHPGVEWELDANMQRTGRWRRRQYYAEVRDKRVPGERQMCEWRTVPPR